MRKTTVVLIGLCLATGMAGADTLVLSTGVRVDGEVKERPDGLIELKAGNRTVVYRPEEVTSHEKNDRRGGFDMGAARARVAEKQREMEEKTGLTAEQRARVDEILHQMATASSDSERIRHRDALVNLQGEMNVYGYLAWRCRAVLHPWTLEVMYRIKPTDTVPKLRRGTQDPWFETRRAAIEILGSLGVRDASELVVRGLADHKPEVRLGAITAVAQLKIYTATPVLIEHLTSPNQKLANASRDALKAMWAAKLGETKPASVEEWTTFWQAQPEAQQAVYAMATLQPLIPEADERVFE